MKIIQELYDLKTVCVGGMQIWIFWILENCWNYKKIIEFSQESTILGKLQWSCGKLEPKLSKLGQFWSGEIANYFAYLMLKHPVPIFQQWQTGKSHKDIIRQNWCKMHQCAFKTLITQI